MARKLVAGTKETIEVIAWISHHLPEHWGGKLVGGAEMTDATLLADAPVEVKTFLPQDWKEAMDFDQIVIESRGEAEEVLERLGDLVVEYDTVTLGELYRMVGITPSFVDDRWGWTDLRGAPTQRVSNGYVLVLPPATYLD